MSEQPQEVPQDEPTPDVPDVPDEAPDEAPLPDETPDQPDETPDEEQSEQDEEAPETPEAPAMSEKELEQAYKKLDKLRETNASRVSSIMGEDALALIVCPACSDVAPGFVWPPEVAPLSEEAELGVRQLLGIGRPRELKRHNSFRTCSGCDGEGFIDTGAKREGYESATCPECSGKGYLSQNEVPTYRPPNGNSEHDAITTGPTVYDAELPPEAQALRDQGWMVAPPFQIQNPA